MKFDRRKYLNFERDLRRILKKHKKAGQDVDRFEQELAVCQLDLFGDSMQDKPADLPDLWKFRIALKSENIGARKGLRLIAIRTGDCMDGVAVYTHDEFQNQPPWRDICAWVGDE